MWAPEAGRDELRRSVVQHVVDPAAVLVLDETGFLKKGHHAAGVARQYSGTAGKVDNCQIGVFLGYGSALGHVLLDRELYLPEEWTTDRGRSQRAGIPEDRGFATKPQLAQQMLARAFTTGVPATWGTGDSVYGNERRLRLWLEAQPRAYGLAVSGQEYVWLGGRHGKSRRFWPPCLRTDGRGSARGRGAKAPARYDWRWQSLADPVDPAWRRWLLVRRSVSAPTELQAYVVFAPQEATLAEVVRVAGNRWTIESCFEAAKRAVGLDQYEVRSWTGWYRPITLAMGALALLVVLYAGAMAVDALQ